VVTAQALANLVNLTNENLGTLRESQNLVEFKLTGAYAKGTLTTDDPTVEAVIIFSVAPTKQAISNLALALTPLFPALKVRVEGTYIIISDGTITLHLATSYLQAWQADRKLYTAPNSTDYVDVDSCQKALLCIRQVLWFEPNYMGILAPNPRIIAKLFRLVAKRHKPLQSLSSFDQLVLIWWALKDGPVRPGLSQALRQVISYIASGHLLPAGDQILNPVKDYKIHLFSKLTRDEEIKLADWHREHQTVTVLPPDIEALSGKAVLCDVERVNGMVDWAQKTVRSLAYEGETGWDKLFGGLPPAPPTEQIATNQPIQTQQ